MNKTIEKYQPIVIAIILILLFYSARDGFNNTLWHTIDAIVTIGTVIGVWSNYKQNKARKTLETKRIPIYFENIDTKDRYLLNLDIQVKYFIRSEIQGLLSAFQEKPAERYIIQYLSELNFLEDIYKIQNNQLDQLTIKVTEEELKGGYEYQKNSIHSGFNLKKMKKQ